MHKINLFVENELYEKLKTSGNISKAVRNALYKHLEIPEPAQDMKIGRPVAVFPLKIKRLKKMLQYIVENYREIETGWGAKLFWDTCLLESFDNLRKAELTLRKLTFVFHSIGIDDAYVEVKDSRNISDKKMLEMAEMGEKVELTNLTIGFSKKVTEEDFLKAERYIEDMEFL